MVTTIWATDVRDVRDKTHPRSVAPDIFYFAKNGVYTLESNFRQPLSFSPYDVVLGEDCLLKHRSVVDYVGKVLYGKGADGGECR